MGSRHDAFAPVAQGIEHQFPVLGVGGSNPSRRTKDLYEGRSMVQKFRRELDELTQQHPGAMVLLLNGRGEYIYVSQECRALLGYEPAEMLGHGALEFAAPEDVAHVEVTLQDAILNGESVTVSIRVRASSRQLIPVRGGIARLNDPESGDTYMIGWVSKV
jgi:PAS domain S-box-containing protein